MCRDIEERAANTNVVITDLVLCDVLHRLVNGINGIFLILFKLLFCKFYFSPFSFCLPLFMTEIMITDEYGETRG